MNILPDAFLKELITILGTKGVLSQTKDVAPYLKDERGLMESDCSIVLRPANTNEVSKTVILCGKYGVPIVPLGFWSSKNLKLKSWDSFLVTLPFSTCSFVWDEPLIIPNNITDEKIEYFQNILQKKINISIQKAKNNCK